MYLLILTNIIITITIMISIVIRLRVPTCQGEPLVLYSSNAGFLQKWRIMLQIMVILDPTKHA